MKCNLIIISVLVPFVIVWIITLLLAFNKYSKIDKDLLRKDYVLKKAVGRSRTWLISTTFWMLAEYLFIIIPFVSNVIVIYSSVSTTNNPDSITVYSIISLSFIVFGFAIKPQNHKKCYRKAYSLMDKEINKYLVSVEGDNSDKNALIGAIKDGEGFIDLSYDIE